MATPLINSVADATAHRDRDNLNHAIAALVCEHVQASCVRMLAVSSHEGEATLLPRLTVPSQAGECLPLQSEMERMRYDTAWRKCSAKRSVQQIAAGGRRLTFFPIENETACIGLLEVHTDMQLSGRDRILVSTLLRILKNHLSLLDYGERDTLTGLLNRKTFDCAFEKLRTRVVAPGADRQPSWLGILDIDKFKSINDGYGHLFGDEVLLLVSRLMQETYRGADWLFRFGGEEFVVLLNEATAEGAAIAFERIRQRVEAYRFPQVGRVTVSIGYTALEPGDGSTSCIERADTALYYAKQHGRNQAHCYESLLAAGRLAAKLNADDIELF